MGSENDGGDCSHPERFDGHRASRGGRSREGQRGVAADVGACKFSRGLTARAQPRPAAWIAKPCATGCIVTTRRASRVCAIVSPAAGPPKLTAAQKAVLV